MNDGSRGTSMVTAGLDLGDKYSYLCLIDTESGKVVEEVEEDGYRLLRSSEFSGIR